MTLDTTKKFEKNAETAQENRIDLLVKIREEKRQHKLQVQRELNDKAKEITNKHKGKYMTD